MKAMTLLVAGLAIVLATGPSRAATSVQSGNWNSTGTWGGSVPGTLEDVVVAAGHSVTVDVATASLNSFTNNGILVFTGWSNKLTAAEVTVNGTITHLVQSDTIGTVGVYSNWTPDNRIWLVCSNLTVSGAINANYKGYQANAVPNASGRGPGGGPYTTSSSTQGAGHGGAAARGRDGAGGVAYGSLTEPEDPGSSGGTGYQYDLNRGIGGAGGGAVRIDATGAVIVDGGITVDGQASGSDHSGGGSGGSIYMACGSIGGTGTLSACGGNVNGVVNGTSSAGAGGRIVVRYQAPLQQAAPALGLRIRTAAGIYSYLGNLSEDGTYYLQDSLFLKPRITDTFQGVRFYGVTNWAADYLAIEGASITFAEELFGRLELTNTFTIRNGSFRINPRVFTMGGDMTLTNSVMRLYVPITNNNTVAFGCDVTVGGNIRLDPGSWIYPASHPTNGSSVRFSAANIFVASNAGFNATALGYRGGRVAGEKGYGPGGTTVGANNTSGGAGYGGRGGDSMRAANNLTGFGGLAYGSADSPNAPGSGGGAGWSGYVGGDGGGLIRLEASGTVTMNGLLEANGTYSGSSHSGSGSGGGIYIGCQVFAGTNGVIRASGAGAIVTGDGAPGGGGRIAVRYNPDVQPASPVPSVQFQASAGGGHPYTLSPYTWIPIAPPDPGTLYLSDNRFLSGAIGDRFRDVRFFGWSAWSAPFLTVSNNNIHFGESNFNLTVAGDVSVKGAGSLWMTNRALMSIGGNLHLTNSAIHVVNVSCDGNLRLDAGSRFNAYAFVTNGAGTNFGGLVRFGGDVVVASNAWIFPVSHPTNGASTLFRVHSLNLSGGTGGGINARGLGFQGGRYAGPLSAGQGPGGGGAAVGNSGAGGGHGGVGGKARAVAGGGSYDSALTPVQPGSGGGRCGNFNGGDGGGLVRFEAEREIAVNGVIDARGTHVLYDHDGGGAGGGIYLRCHKISGSASLLADGGGMTGGNGGNGGGGRIAVYFVQGLNAFSGSASVLPTYTVTPTYTPLPGTGTVHWVEIPPYTIMLVR